MYRKNIFIAMQRERFSFLLITRTTYILSFYNSLPLNRSLPSSRSVALQRRASNNAHKISHETCFVHTRRS